MIVTTIDLLNYLRCTRYAPLDRVAQERRYEKQGIDDKFQEILYLSGLSNFETSTESDDEVETIINPENTSQEILISAMNTFKKIVGNYYNQHFIHAEIQSNRVLSISFSDEVILSTKIDYLAFESSLITSTTVLPIIDKDLLKLKYTVDKDRRPFFKPNIEGIYFPDRFSNYDNVKNNYDDKLKKLMDRHHSLGRHLYFLAFKYFILKKNKK